MGMDLKPRNPEIEWFHANWGGWAMLADALFVSGCDVSKMSGSNDGEYVDAATCRRWAKTLRGERPHLYWVEWPGSRNGLRNVLHIGDGWTLWQAQQMGSDLYRIEGTKWVGEFIDHFVEFLDQCRGFWQF